MTRYTFGDLVGDEQTFVSQYFNTKPMLRRKALPAAHELLSMRKLDELVQLEIVRPPYIKVNLNGDGVHEKGYTRDVVVQGTTITDVVEPEKIYELYRAGATVTWCSLNQIVPELRAFTRNISEAMAVRTDSVAFLTPSGKKGYPPHHDPVDLFIVQLEGSKHWKLWNPPTVRLGDNEQYTLDELGEPVIDVSLQPGDVLYLPYGTPHAAEAEDRASLHLSIMMRPRMWRDLLRQTMERVLDGPEFSEYPYLGALRDDAVDEQFVGKVRTLAERMLAVDPHTELDRLAEVGRRMPGSSTGNTFQSINELDGIGPNARLRRTTVHVEFGESTHGRTQLTVNGNKIAVPASIAETLVELDTQSSVLASDLFPAVGPVRSTKAAQGLTRLGVLEVATAG